MKLQPSTVQCLEITEFPGLDPIRVFTQDYEPGQGRIVITCWDMAWCAYWGAMSGQTIRGFFLSCDAEYLAGNLGQGSGLKQDHRSRTYLVRVVTAVQEAFSQQRAAEERVQ